MLRSPTIFDEDYYTSAYVQGTGIGPVTSFFPGTETRLGSIGNLNDIAVDGQQNVFFTAGQFDDGYPGPGGVIQGYWGSLDSDRLSSDAMNPVAVVVDGAGNVCMTDAYGGPFVGGDFIALPGGYQLQRYTPYAPCPPQQVVDRDGDVYSHGGQLYKETLNANGTYTQTTVPLELTGISAVGIDGNENLFAQGSDAASSTSTSGLFRESLQPNGTYIQTAISDSLSVPTRCPKVVDTFRQHLSHDAN